jgi:hypothetical protein
MKKLTCSFGAFALSALLLQTASFAAETQGVQNLFNGKDLTGWSGNPKFWSVRDGVITGQTTPDNPTKGNTFLIWTNGVVDDFELRFSYKMIGGNSGVQYRSRDRGNWVVHGYQADFEAGKTYSGILYEEGGRGILAQRGQMTVVHADPGDPKKHRVEVLGSVGKTDELQAGIKHEDWNDYIIIAKGNMLIHQINGRVTMVCRDDHAERAAASGVLALQLHAGPPMTLQMKNIQLKPLK